jgi:ABC-type enterochelin transport system permease subunit
MEVQFSGNPKPFGIIGLVLAILSLLFSMIPCVGFYAIIPSSIAVIFCLIAFIYARQKKEKNAVPLSGLIIGVVAISIGIFQYYKYKTVFDTKTQIENSLNQVGDSIKEGVKDKVLEGIKNKIEKELENDSIQKVKTDSIH